MIPNLDPQPRVPVIRRPAYTVSLEQHGDHSFVHCDVRAWSPSARQALSADWQAFQALHGGPILALHTPGDRKHLKFLTLFGFHRVTSYVDRLHGPQELFST